VQRHATLEAFGIAATSVLANASAEPGEPDWAANRRQQEQPEWRDHRADSS